MLLEGPEARASSMAEPFEDVGARHPLVASFEKALHQRRPGFPARDGEQQEWDSRVILPHGAGGKNRPRWTTR